MHKMKIGPATRVLFAQITTFLWLGIYFTGFENTNILIYIPSGVLTFAWITGLCPGALISRTILGK